MLSHFLIFFLIILSCLYDHCSFERDCCHNSVHGLSVFSPVKNTLLIYTRKSPDAA